MKKRYLLLENGMRFEGVSAGSEGEGLGEVVFTTGMTGYLETLTDPSYAGQIVTQAFPLIGNVGVIPEDFEGKTSFVRGYIARELCPAPSNFREQGVLDGLLKAWGIPALTGIDTRLLVRVIRETGVMNGVITFDPERDLSDVRGYRVSDVVSLVSGKTAEEVPAEGDEKAFVALLDYGAKQNIVRSLAKRGCRVLVLPHDTPAEEILALSPDGVMLSNGPGDPAECVKEAAELRKIAGKIPLFGICLGHQLLALALGGRTEKLKFGHRGANVPVLEKKTGLAYITSQNHGYTVLSETLSGVGEESFCNLNDRSCEGMDYPGLGAFSVQFHPEGCGGPQDTGFLFDRFLQRMKGDRNA